MNLLPAVQIAFRALAKNKLRGGLTVSGVVIGVTAVTTLVSLGQSASYLVENELQGFTDREIVTRAKVCVLGQTLVEKLFQTTNPIGKTIRIKNIPFEVVGVLEAKGRTLPAWTRTISSWPRSPRSAAG